VIHRSHGNVRNRERCQPWLCDIERFRDLRDVHCKISAIFPEDGQNWTPARLLPYREAIFDIFGGDWSVVNYVADCTRWIETLEYARK
jgi:L-fuconolactonase